MIAVGIEPKQRQPEAVLAPRRAMAAPGVATRPQEQRHDVEAETQRRILAGPLDMDGNRKRLLADGHLDGRVAVGDGTEDAPFESHSIGILDGERRLGRDITSYPVGRRRLDDKRLAVPTGREVDRGRVNRQALGDRHRGDRILGPDAGSGKADRRQEHRPQELDDPTTNRDEADD